MGKELEWIKCMESADLLECFEKCIQEGAGINSIPFLWYRKEILFRMDQARGVLQRILEMLNKPY